MPFRPSFGLTGAELFDLTDEMRQNRQKIVEEISSAFVHGTIQWRKELGHPLVVDFGRAFFVTLAITQSANEGEGRPAIELPGILQFDIPYSLGEDGTHFRLGFRGLMPNTLTVNGHDILHWARVAFVEGASWLDANGQLSAMPVVSPSDWLRFRKRGETSLPPFEVVHAS